MRVAHTKSRVLETLFGVMALIALQKSDKLFAKVTVFIEEIRLLILLNFPIPFEAD